MWLPSLRPASPGPPRLQDPGERGFRLLAIMAVAVPLLAFVGAAWYDHDQVIRAERSRVSTSADAIAGQAQAVMETSVLALDLVVDRVRGMSMDDIRDSESLHEFFVGLTKKLPQLESVFVVSPDGHNIASSRAFPMPDFDDSGRDYYLEGRQPGAIFISKPFYGKTNGSLAFVVTRAMRSGALAGVTISGAYFDRYYASVVDPRTDAVISLARRDGFYLLRYPSLGGRYVGRLAAPPVLEDLHGTGPDLFVTKSPVDGHQRLVAVRALRDFPMTAIYALGTAGYMGAWYRHVAVLAILAGVMAAALVYATNLAALRARTERAALRRLLAETERREQAEAALRQSQKMDALGRLAGGVAHDFNNLLAAIMGSLQLAMRRTTDARVLRLLDGAIEAAQRGARLTRQMLAFARHEQPVIEAVEIASLLGAVHDMLRRTMGPGIVLRFAAAPDLWWARVERTQLEVGLLNLAINGRDAMPEGGELRLEAENLAAGAARPALVPAGEFVRIRIADSGSGMPADVLRRATEPFFTTKPVGQGTGLGLSMVDGLVRQCGGVMSIDSAPGEGTVIGLYLPRAAPAVAAAEDPADAASAVALPARRLSVLLVDDDASVRTATAGMLAELGHAVIEAADGPQGLASAEQTPVDLAIVDFAMPGMDGEQVALALTARHPGLPVLLLTGYADRAHADAASSGFAGLLAKPCSIAEIDQAVQAALRAPAAAVRQTVQSG